MAFRKYFLVIDIKFAEVTKLNNLSNDLSTI